MEIKLPKLGEGADSGTVVNVLVQEGDAIEKGQNLIELENEKAVAPIPATASGTVQSLRVKVGDKVSVGQVLAVLGEAKSSSSETADPESRSAPKAEAKPEASREPSSAPAPSAAPGEVVNPDPVAAPSLRKMARQLGLDLTRVRGTGSGGRIEMGDVRDYVKRLQTAASPSAKAAAAPSERIDFSQWGPIRISAMTAIRQTISRRMTENWQSIPHVTQFEEVDITDLNTLRKEHAAAYDALGAKLTLTPLVIAAVVVALKKHPLFNASLDEATREIVFKDYYHIGLAVDTEQGLLVPVIRDADRKSLVDLSREVNEKAEKARQRSLSLDDMKGGTFTISNQGGIGGGYFTPIINKPEVAILGVGRGQMKWRPGKEGPEARLLMPLGLSYDHRLIDGGSAARFITDLAAALSGLGEDAIRPDVS